MSRPAEDGDGHGHYGSVRAQAELLICFAHPALPCEKIVTTMSMDNNLVLVLKRTYTEEDTYNNSVAKWLAKEAILTIEDLALLAMDEKAV